MSGRPASPDDRTARGGAKGTSRPVSDSRDRQSSTLDGRLNSRVKQQQQPFHEREMLCVQHTGSCLLVVFFSL